jgi:tripartite-type tricarboxylate transporter receptor subunit TctC
VFGSVTSLAINPSVQKNLPYDPIKDFAPVALCVTTPLYLVLHPSVPAKNVKELIALARARPGQLAYGSGGNGSSNHLVGELFQMMTGVKFSHVPYKGTGAALVDLAGGQVDLLFDQASSTVPNVRGGKIRAIAVASRERQATLPDTPTFAEAGLRDFVIDNITGIVGPAGLAPDIVGRIHGAAVKALATPNVRERFASLGMQPVGNSPGEFAAFIREDLARWEKVIKQAGIKVE